MMPMYEGKMIHHFDHRWASFDGLAVRDVTPDEKQDPHVAAQPRYWVPAKAVSTALAGRWDRRWLASWRDIARTTDERTVIFTIVPSTAIGHTSPVFLAPDAWIATAGLNTFVVDFSARQKIGGTHLTYSYLKQLPVVPPPMMIDSAWSPIPLPPGRVKALLLELTYTAWDMAPFAEELGDVDNSGGVNPPFVWDGERRFWLRAELDAAFFHYYGVARDDVDYIMDTFPIVRRRDEAVQGEYRTKRVILELFDAMQTAIDTGLPYPSPISPLPGEGPRHWAGLDVAAS